MCSCVVKCVKGEFAGMFIYDSNYADDDNEHNVREMK